MIYLRLPELLHVAARALGSEPAVRDYGLLESALARPPATAGPARLSAPQLRPARPGTRPRSPLTLGCPPRSTAGTGTTAERAAPRA